MIKVNNLILFLFYFFLFCFVLFCLVNGPSHKAIQRKLFRSTNSGSLQMMHNGPKTESPPVHQAGSTFSGQLAGPIVIIDIIIVIE